MRTRFSGRGPDLDLPTRYYQALCLLAGLLVTLIIVPLDLAQQLGRLGYRTLTAADGAEGVELFRRHRHELSGGLLDLKMRRMGGRAAFEQMHAIAPDVRCCSARGTERTKRRRP